MDTTKTTISFDTDEMHRQMLDMVAKDRGCDTDEVLIQSIEKEYVKTRSNRRGRPFVCRNTGEVFSSAKECRERFGILAPELNECLYRGKSFEGLYFDFIR